jgi:predicted membrane protein
MTAPVPAAAARPAPTSSLNTRLFGGLLLVFGTGWMLKAAGVVDLPWTAVFSLVLIALGLALVITARSRVRTVPLIMLGAILTAGLAVGSSNINFKGGIGEQVLRPTTVGTARSYRLFVGEMVLDLRHTAFTESVTTINADVGVGHLQVRVPDGIGVLVDVDANVGNAVVFGDRLNVHGRSSDRRQTEGYDTAAQKLHLVLHIGAGQIDVTR